MQRNRVFLYSFILTMAIGARLSTAATIVGAIEDAPGITYEHNGDYNDIIFELTGDISINAPGGAFNNLTSGAVNESGTVFWDNPSLDGPHMNIGYMLLNDGAFHNLEYLALPSGGSVNNVTFDATGPVTLTYLGGITAGTKANTLGWYSVANPGAENQLIAWPDYAGESATFNPGGDFGLYSSNGTQAYNSVATSNIDESGNQQHFAFFEQPSCQPPQVPEPSSAALAGVGVALLGLGMVSRRRKL